MNANVKLGLMAIAAAVVANKVLAPPFAGLAPVQKQPAAAYGGTVLALCGVGAIVMKKQPKAAVLLAGAAAGLGVAGYQAGARRQEPRRSPLLPLARRRPFPLLVA